MRRGSVRAIDPVEREQKCPPPKNTSGSLRSIRQSEMAIDVLPVPAIPASHKMTMESFLTHEAKLDRRLVRVPVIQPAYPGCSSSAASETKLSPSARQGSELFSFTWRARLPDLTFFS